VCASEDAKATASRFYYCYLSVRHNLGAARPRRIKFRLAPRSQGQSHSPLSLSYPFKPASPGQRLSSRSTDSRIDIERGFLTSTLGVPRMPGVAREIDPRSIFIERIQTGVRSKGDAQRSVDTFPKRAPGNCLSSLSRPGGDNYLFPRKGCRGKVTGHEIVKTRVGCTRRRCRVSISRREVRATLVIGVPRPPSLPRQRRGR